MNMTAIDDALKAMSEASAEISRLRARVEHLENVLAVIAVSPNGDATILAKMATDAVNSPERRRV